MSVIGINHAISLREFLNMVMYLSKYFLNLDKYKTLLKINRNRDINTYIYMMNSNIFVNMNSEHKLWELVIMEYEVWFHWSQQEFCFCFNFILLQGKKDRGIRNDNLKQLIYMGFNTCVIGLWNVLEQEQTSEAMYQYSTWPEKQIPLITGALSL